jgi:hypothetical protein
MQVETLGEALAAGWRVHARCLGGVVEYTRSAAKCHHQTELSLETLAWTRGRNMQLSGLRERMMCPRCGNPRQSDFGAAVRREEGSGRVGLHAGLGGRP